MVVFCPNMGVLKCWEVTVCSWCAVAAAALLERQMVVFCPNMGVLSAAVLALVPLMRPFAWQSLLLPVLPVQEKMLDLLEAPVPFIFGIKVPPSVLHIHLTPANAPFASKVPRSVSCTRLAFCL